MDNGLYKVKELLAYPVMGIPAGLIALIALAVLLLLIVVSLVARGGKSGKSYTKGKFRDQADYALKVADDYMRRCHINDTAAQRDLVARKVEKKYGVKLENFVWGEEHRNGLKVTRGVRLDENMVVEHVAFDEVGGTTRVALRSDDHRGMRLNCSCQMNKSTLQKAAAIQKGVRTRFRCQCMMTFVMYEIGEDVRAHVELSNIQRPYVGLK